MLLRALRVADDAPAPADFIDELPGFSAARNRRVGVREGRAAGLFADRLRLLPPLHDRGHARLDGGGFVLAPLEQRFGEDEPLARPAMAVCEVHVGVFKDVTLAAAVIGDGFDENVLRLLLIGAGVHGERAADGSRNAAIKLKSCNARPRGCPRDLRVERGSAGAHANPID